MNVKPGLTASWKLRMIAMRITAALTMAALVVTIGYALPPLPARGQAYDPRYPICMLTYGFMDNIACRHTSMEQCRFLDQGRPAQCIVNPFFAGATGNAGRRIP
jgi:Protein of unknown function (DUF3551)